MAKKKAKTEKPVTYQQAVKRLPAAVSKREHLLAEYHRVHAAFHAAHDELSSAYKALARTDRELKKHQQVIDRLRAVVDLGAAPPALEEREVDAPLLTDAEYLHLKELDPNAVNVHKSKALFSMDEYIGGFSRFPADRRKPHHEMAASRFLSLYDRSQLGGAKATDMSQPFVDTSTPGSRDVSDFGAEAREEYHSIKKALGEERRTLLERVIVGRVSARQIAAEHCGKTPSTVHGKAVAVVAQQVWDAIEALAEIMGFAAVGNK